MPARSGAPVLVASNRGPLSFSLDPAGRLSSTRGGGGLVSGLSSVARDGEAVWVCAALSDADRQAAAAAPDGRLDRAEHDTGGMAVQMLDLDPTTFHRAYNAIANSVLWFVQHHLYDTPNAPVFDHRFRREWEGYRRYNQAFADALAGAAAEGAKVVVQDYHLTLAPRLLRARRDDLRIGHFSHTPWATPDYFRVLPDDVGRAVLEGILGADHAGFLADRWAEAFLDCCEQLLGADVDRQARTVVHDGHRTQVGVHALGTDGEWLRDRVEQPDVAIRRAGLERYVGDARLVVRIDRTELSKNIVRGLAAYRELLRTHPEWHGKVIHFALAYPSRHDLPEYREYTAAVQRIAAEISDEFATDDWKPLILQVDDDLARSLAAYQIGDVLVVNPIRDGMNLVAKEGPVVSRDGIALVLSREAGCFAELGADAIGVNPFDVTATAEALHEALLMPAEERAARTRRLAAAATACPPQRWFAEQLDALDR